MDSSTRSLAHRRPARTGRKLSMAPQRVLGIVMLLAGIASLTYGINAARVAADPNGPAGSLARIENWFVFGGLGLALAGFILAVIGHRRIKAE